jgi:hypothetical protein
MLFTILWSQSEITINLGLICITIFYVLFGGRIKSDVLSYFLLAYSPSNNAH